VHRDIHRRNRRHRTNPPTSAAFTCKGAVRADRSAPRL